MTPRSLAAVCISALIMLPGPVSAESRRPFIEGIRGKIQGKEARVQFTVQNAFPPEMVEALKSGIEISFRTQIRVERVFHGWFDRTLGEVKFSRSVRYDALSRVYRLNRGGAEEALPGIFEALKGMTEYDVALPVSEEPERGKPYRAYVRTRLDKVGLSEPLRSVFFFSALWDIRTEWSRGNLATP